jgi:hypothetical protein
MNIKLPVIIVLILALGLAACKKNDDIPSEDEGLVTNLNVVNADSDTLNFYINGTRINNTSSLYPLGSSGYIGVPYGQQDYQFKKLGSPVVLFTLPLMLDTSKNYSLFVAGNATDKVFLTVDEIKASTTVARIRFAHTSPDAGAIDVTVGDTVKFLARAFKTATSFVNVNAGIKRIRIYKAGTSTLLSDETKTLVTGNVYTLFTKGQLGGNGDAKFGTGLSVNR